MPDKVIKRVPLKLKSIDPLDGPSGEEQVLQHNSQILGAGTVTTPASEVKALKPYETYDGVQPLFSTRGNIDGLVGYSVAKDKDGRNKIMLRTKPGDAIYDIESIDVEEWNKLDHESRQKLVKDMVAQSMQVETSGKWSNTPGAGEAVQGLGTRASRTSLKGGDGNVQTSNFFDKSLLTPDEQKEYEFSIQNLKENPELQGRISELENKGKRKAFNTTDTSLISRVQ
jgi:hypothetical protein